MTLTSIVVRILKVVRVALSPLLPGASCRFTPTCSRYAEEALTRYGLLKGFGLTIWRLLRCHPLADGGVDPVPPCRPPGGESPLGSRGDGAPAPPSLV